MNIYIWIHKHIIYEYRKYTYIYIYMYVWPAFCSDVREADKGDHSYRTRREKIFAEQDNNDPKYKHMKI